MQVMIRCKVRPDGVEADLKLLQEVYEEMRSVQPKGLRYATFQLEDKVTFVSFAEMDEGPEVLQQLKAFQRLRATPDERFDEPPVLTMLHEVGSYGFRCRPTTRPGESTVREGLRVQSNGDLQREGL
jgi:quinol monooxygenase YgiN